MTASKARMEAHITHGIIAGVEYWDDAKLMAAIGPVKSAPPFLSRIGNIFQGQESF